MSKFLYPDIFHSLEYIPVYHLSSESWDKFQACTVVFLCVMIPFEDWNTSEGEKSTRYNPGARLV